MQDTVSASVLATVAGAQAADLPTRKAAPVQYVKICDAYGAGFFYIPGTDTCLRVGGLVLAQAQVSNTPYQINGSGVASLNRLLGGAQPYVTAFGGIPAGMIVGDARDAVSWFAMGRLELDARTQSPWGTLRSFIRVDSVFGSGAVANTGSSGRVSQGTIAAKDITFLSKAFIQFAGLTMGRIQSMFDFYADAAGAATSLRGSNQTVNGLAYTATFGGGFSATLSLEDAISHRAMGTANSVVVPSPVPVIFPVTGAITPVAYTVSNWVPPGSNVQFLGTRLPDIVANLRVDQPWGSAQISGAIHRVGVGLYNGLAGLLPGGAPLFLSPALPTGGLLAKTDNLGFAVQGGLKFNLPMIAPGDALWLQATYANGAVGYTNGSNQAYVNGIDFSTNMGVGFARVSSGNGWNMVTDGDCVFTYSGSCEHSKSWAVDAALLHNWSPTVSQTLTASYYQVNYSANALNPAPTAFAFGASMAGLGGGLLQPWGVGVTNYKEFIFGTGLNWHPVKGFSMVGEFTWMHGMVSRPVGLAPDIALNLAGLPSFKGTSDLFRGTLRMVRAF